MYRIKKYIFCAIIALVSVSCDKMLDEPELETLFSIPTSLSAHTPEFDTQTPVSKSGVLLEYQPENWDNAGVPGTRTYAVVDPGNSSEYFQYWSENDAISVFYTDANLQYVLNDLKEDDYGYFDLVGDAVTGMNLNTDYFYAVYPYKAKTSINYENGVITYNFPSTQHYSGDSYAKDENGMLAIEPKNECDDRFYFQNFCSYLQLRLITKPEQPKKVKQIILVANNSNDKITGDASIKVVGSGSELKPVVEMKMTASNQIILDCGSGVELSYDSNNPTKFWFVLPGGFTFTDGFKVTVTFDDNTYFEKSTSKTIFIERSHIKPMATFSAEEDDDIILSGPIRYKYNDTSINEPYNLDNAQFIGKDGSKLQVINQVYDPETQEWVVYLSGTLYEIGGNVFKEKKPDIEYIVVEEETENDSPIAIGDFAFYNCTAEEIIIHNNVESIGNAVLKGSKVQEFIIDGAVSIIKEDAFTGCTRLQTFEVESVETIQKGAFQMCINLSDVSIPGVKYIEASAFEDCYSLTSITLDSVIEIYDAAFMGCSSLEFVEISSNCIMIGEGAFCNAESLETVICRAVKPPFIKTDNTDGSYVFDEAPDTLCIYIPNGSLSYYTDPVYFITNPSGYASPVQTTVNWWYQEYTSNLKVSAN